MSVRDEFMAFVYGGRPISEREEDGFKCPACDTFIQLKGWRRSGGDAFCEVRCSGCEQLYTMAVTAKTGRMVLEKVKPS